MAQTAGNRPGALSTQITRMTIILIAIAIALITSFGWWVVTRIDERSLARQSRSVHVGLDELIARVPIEQDSSAIWDDAVINARTNNEAWLAENLVEWMSDYFGHDRVYLLDSADNPVRASVAGAAAEPDIYAEQRAAIEPLVHKLRVGMAEASSGLSDSTAATTGMGEIDLVAMQDGSTAIVSVRPVLPSSNNVQQAPGSEFLLVSVRQLGPSVSADISEKFALNDLDFDQTRATVGGRVSSPVLNSAGRIVGFFNWTPDLPASELMLSTAPAATLGLIAVFAGFGLLLLRLRRTSAKLEVSEAHAQYLAFHDPLTGLPNRALFEDRLERALASMRRTNGKIALHYVDLDRFKHVNDSLGHPAGDELIRQVARRLSEAIREVDTIARLGGDEFAIIQVDAADESAAERLCESVIAEVARPFDLSGDDARVGASVGVVVSSSPDATPKDMMRRADIALYEAKANGRGRYQVFAGDMDDVVRQRRSLERDLRYATETGNGLELLYQPIYDAQAQRVLGAEALVRWDHPSRGMLRPDLFIGLAEERGLIEQLGAWVLKAACRFAASSSIPWVAVNVSPLQFRDEHFADRVFAILRECGLAANRLEIEVTEGLLLQNSPIVQNTLLRLRAAGIRVALDDFGTGYSSISYLRTYGVDKLKIDRSFVNQLGMGSNIDSIVLSIIQLARAMNMQVTAEGIETELQRDILVAMACNQLQGFLLSRPISETQLADLLPDALRAAS